MNLTGAQLDNDLTSGAGAGRFDEAPQQILPCAPGHRSVGVCHIAAGDQWAGAEVQVATLLRALSRYPNLQLSAILLNPGRLAEELRSCNIEVKVIPEQEKSFREIYRHSASFLQGRNVHILHSHRYKENLLATLLARRCRVPHRVRTQHGWPEAGGIKQTLVYAMDRITARLAADRVISVSSDLTGYLKTHLPAGKIAVIRNGIDLEQVHSGLSTAAAKRRLGISESALVMGTVSRLEPVKRLDLFLLAAGEVARNLPEAVFAVVGEGSQLAHLRSLIQGTDLEARVLFLGHRDDVYDALRALDVLVIASDREGLPMVLLEAMALGVPIVSRKVGGIPEVVEDGVTGILVPSSQAGDLARACIATLRDKELRDRLARAAREFVEQSYSAAANAAAIQELYRSLSEVK